MASGGGSIILPCRAGSRTPVGCRTERDRSIAAMMRTQDDRVVEAMAWLPDWPSAASRQRQQPGWHVGGSPQATGSIPNPTNANTITRCALARGARPTQASTTSSSSSSRRSAQNPRATTRPSVLPRRRSSCVPRRRGARQQGGWPAAQPPWKWRGGRGGIGENCVTSTCFARTGLAIERRSLRHLTRCGPPSDFECTRERQQSADPSLRILRG